MLLYKTFIESWIYICILICRLGVYVFSSLKYICMYIECNCNQLPIQSRWETWQVKGECTGLCWWCYKCTTVRISYTNTGLYNLTLIARFPIHSVPTSTFEQMSEVRVKTWNPTLLILENNIPTYWSCTSSSSYTVFIIS